MSADDLPDQSLVDRIGRLLSASWERASDLTEESLGRADAVLNRAVDRAVSARFEVADAEAFQRALESKPSADSSIANNAALLTMITGVVSRFGALKRIPGLAGRSNAWIAGALLAGNRTRNAVSRGLREVQVLASYLAGRAARENVELDDRLLRALTIAVYLDPSRKADLRFRGTRAGAALAGQWATNALRTVPRSESVIRSWVSAIDNLPLTELKAEWDRAASKPIA